MLSSLESQTLLARSRYGSASARKGQKNRSRLVSSSDVCVSDHVCVSYVLN